MTTFDLPPTTADDALKNLAKAPTPEPCPPVDWEKVGDEYIQQARRSTARTCWDKYCPPEYRDSDWTFTEQIRRNRPQIDRVLAWQPGGKGLLLSGPTGRGKTRSMWQLLRRLSCNEARTFRYWHATEFFGELQEQVRYGRDEAGRWIKANALTPLVFIDDLGQQALSESKANWAEGWLFRYLDMRVEHALPLFVTTNLTAAQLAETKSNVRGDPLVRRLLDICDPIKFEI